MTEAELKAKAASYDIGCDTYGDFESYNLLRVEAKRARELRLDLCGAFRLDCDTTTDEVLTRQASQLAGTVREVYLALEHGAVDADGAQTRLGDALIVPPPDPLPEGTTAAADSYPGPDDPAVQPVTAKERRES